MSNALTITSTFTYTACEFPTAVAKIFSITRLTLVDNSKLPQSMFHIIGV